ncbi:MAG: ABC transporter permease [Euryarchaeota archaeon]|nr:ABC transporter permease [Euryarchaeota archaeon]
MISDIFTMSLDALRSRKIRTFLTLLGVIIGTGSVIIVATAGNSLKVYIKEQWNFFDPTGIIIGVGTNSKPPQITFTEKVFTDADVKKIEGLPHIKGVAPVGIIAFKKVMMKEGFLKWQTKQGGTMWASTPELLKVLDLKLVSGEIFHEGKNEVLISEGTAQMFGKDTSLSVGDTLYVQQITGRILKAKIVGIYNSSSESNILSKLTVPAMIGPVDPYYTTFFGSNVGGLLRKVTAYTILYAAAVDTESVNKAQVEILEYLNGASDANKYKDEKTDFVFITQEYIQERIEQILSVVNMFITAIAVVSLIVGGIGIANIMFATVTERTREIGTMMAIGAKRRIIMQLFLYQSAIIGLLGGILGCIIGASGGAFIIQILGNYVQELGFSTSSAHLPLIYPMEWFVIATISGLLIGILAGVIPARKAAKMDPVVALRHE